MIKQIKTTDKVGSFIYVIYDIITLGGLHDKRRKNKIYRRK